MIKAGNSTIRRSKDWGHTKVTADSIFEWRKVGDQVTNANAEMMILHRAENSTQAAQRDIAVLTCGGAGWHQQRGAMVVPSSIVRLRRPTYSPELQPMENVWDYLRQYKLDDPVWDSYEAIVEACKAAWNILVASPACFKSNGTRSAER